MSELEFKYNLLDCDAKQEVLDFIDFLLTKDRKSKKSSKTAYKRKILKISVWNDSDINEIIQNQQKLNKWKAAEW